MKKDDVVIFSYTRAQAIADGVLIDATELAKQAGFRFPVALTTGVWAECVAVPAGVAGQDETGRLFGMCSTYFSSPSLGRRATGSGSISRCTSGTTTARETRRSFTSMPSAGRETTRSRSLP